jgi:hypothetical protein
MQVLTRAEAYDNGWQIDDLPQLLAPKYEESYEDPDPAETIRRIARSQDESAYRSIRYYLKARLLLERPQRRYCPELEDIIDDTLTQFYFGEDMAVQATSLTHAKQLNREQAARKQQMAAAIIEIGQELAGVPHSEVDAFITEIIYPKYSQGYNDQEFEEMIEILKTSLAPAKIPDLTPADVFQVWKAPTQSFQTKTLEVGLLSRCGDIRQLEIRRHNDRQCHIFSYDPKETEKMAGSVEAMQWLFVQIGGLDRVHILTGYIDKRF